MRGLVDGLTSPHPMAAGLPAIFQEEDPFTVRFTEAFDDSLAPIFTTLDNLAAYFDPRYAPEDFLGWLAGWVAIELDETWDLARRREAVLGGADLLRRRGTAVGLAAELELATGGQRRGPREWRIGMVARRRQPDGRHGAAGPPGAHQGRRSWWPRCRAGRADRRRGEAGPRPAQGRDSWCRANNWAAREEGGRDGRSREGCRTWRGFGR